MSKLKILHLSDLHIESDAKRYKFHEDLHTFLVEKFKNADLDFIIISGDFGNRCDYNNVTKAKVWLEELQIKLQIPKSKFIFCAGNHDLDTLVSPPQHYRECFNYERGSSYIGNKYPKKNFYKYYEILSEFDQSENEEVIILPNGDLVYDNDKVRFFVINSSWLSTITESSKTALKRKLEKANESNVYETASKLFENVVCIRDFPLNNPVDINNEILKPSFNHSENTRQQIDSRLIEYLKNINITDDKLNIIIFHHPEFCLHFLEHFNFKENSESGSYSELASICDLAICGHIHPNSSLDTNQSSRKLPHLIGGACHLSDKLSKGHPLFYLYEINNYKNHFVFERTEYQVSSSDNLTNYSFEEKKSDLAPQKNIKNKDKQYVFSSKLITNEKTIEEVRYRFQKHFIKYLIGYIKKNSKSIINPKETKTISIWGPNKARDYDYLIKYSVDKITIIDENGKIYGMIIDFIAANMFVNPQLTQIRVDKYSNLDNFNTTENIFSNKLTNDNYIYFPILLDTLYPYLVGEGIEKSKYIEDRIKCANNIFWDPSSIKKLNFFLEKFVKQNVLPDIFYISKLVFMSKNIAESLISKDSIKIEDTNIENKYFII